VPLLIHQPSYSMLNRWVEDDHLLDTLDEVGAGCIAFSPLAQGLLTDRYLHGIPADSRAAENDSLQADSITEDRLARVRALNDIAAARGQSLAQLALVWVLRDPRMTSALIGASSVQQLEQNIAALATPDFTDDSIWVMRVDGTHLRRITDNPFSETGYDTDPNVSPNGKRISFVRVREPDVEQALFSVRWDGSHLRQLTSYSANVAVKHDWSPDGSHLVLTVNADFADAKKSSNVALVRPDGSGFRRLTHYKGRTVNAFVGSYSPNGRWIVYRLENRQGRGTLPDGSFGLYKVHPDGSDRQLIASLINKPRYIAWGSRPAT